MMGVELIKQNSKGRFAPGSTYGFHEFVRRQNIHAYSGKATLARTKNVRQQSAHTIEYIQRNENQCSHRLEVVVKK